MTKEEIKSELDSRGIAYEDDAKKPELVALLEGDKTVEEKSYELEITVEDKFGNVQGIFSRRRQGKDFKNLAYKFAKNKNYIVR